MNQIQINLENISGNTLEDIANFLIQGHVVILPTDTVYGLVCRVDHMEAIEDIFRYKKRPFDKPLPVFIHDISQLIMLVDNIPVEGSKITRRFWPGPLTVLFPCTKENLFPVTRGTGKIGIRMPKLSLMLELIKEIGIPLASTSANISSEKPCNSIMDLETEFLNQVDLVVNAGPIGSGTPSTVLDLTQTPFKILRNGEILEKEILAVLNM